MLRACLRGNLSAKPFLFFPFFLLLGFTILSLANKLITFYRLFLFDLCKAVTRKGFFLVRGRYALMDPQGDRNGPQLNLITIIVVSLVSRILAKTGV